ncbi:MAG: hypothetical protein ACRD2Q_12275 [Terriglobales bacterium]
MKPIHLLLAFLLVSLAWTGAFGEGKAVTLEGWVIDSSCAYTKDLKKPISESCAKECAEGGSPLVILTDDGTVYLPISGTLPATGENRRLMAFAGQRVKVEGTVHDRAGSKAMVIAKIEAVKPAK